MARIVREGFVSCDKADEAIAVDVRELRRAPAAGPDRARILHNLAISLYSRYRCAPSRRDIDAAIFHTRTVLRLMPLRHPDRPAAEGKLAMFLAGRRAPGDLPEAARIARRALAATPPGRPGWAENLAQVADVEFELYKDTNEAARLDAAIGMYAELTEARPLASRGAVPFHLNYAVTRLNRFGTTNWARRDDLDAALSRLTELADCDLSQAPPGAGLVIKSHLIQALGTRYQLDGDDADLARVSDLREELETDPDQALAGRTRALVYDSAATASLSGYLRKGDLSLLGRAVREQQEALSCTPAEDPSRPGLLGNLAVCRLLRHRERRGYPAVDYDDLAEGMRLGREAVTASAGGVYAASSAGILGTLVLEETVAAVAAGQPDLGQVELSVDLLTTARDGMPPGDPQRAVAESKLSQAAGVRCLLHGDMTGLRAAVSDFDTAYAAMPHGSPYQAGMQGARATLLLALARGTGDPGDARRAVEAARQAVRAGSDRHPASALETALQWGTVMWQLGQLALAGEGYAIALRILHGLARTQLTALDKNASLARARDVTARAALALAGQPEAAALALETGRAVALSEALGIEQTRVLDTAARDHPALVHAYQQSVSELRRRQRDPAAPPATAGAAITQAWPRLDDQAALRDARQAVDASISALERALDVELLRPPTGESLRAAVASVGVPVVYLVATEIGGSAVIVRPDGRIHAVPLPALTESLVAEVTRLWGRAAAEEEDFAAADQAADQAADLMWAGLMEPVVGALAGYPEATLVPVGSLGIVPLHAASWRDDDGTRHYAADQVSLGYAPNARILTVCRERAQRLPARPVLLVADPRTDEPVRELPAAVGECETLGRLLPAGEVLGRLYRADATRPAVLSCLRRAALTHFACHARLDRGQPLDGALILAGDGRLSVREVLQEQLPAARLAVLSACGSALIGADLQDEVVSFPSALVQAGLAGVVGSLWEVDDIATAALLARFYELWLPGETTLAAALAGAQRWLRTATNGEIEERFPEIDLEPPTDPGQRRTWQGQRDYPSPHWWAPFIVMGA